MEDSLRDLQDNIKCTNSLIIGVPEVEEKKKGYEKIVEEINIENFPDMEKEIVNQVQEAQSPKEDKPKEKHSKTHTNQTNKDYTQRKNILKAREKQQVTYKANTTHLTADVSGETAGPKGMAGIYLKY